MCCVLLGKSKCCASVCVYCTYENCMPYCMSYCIRYRIRYRIRCVCYLWVLVSKTMAVDVEGIASRLGPSVEVVTFPFDATKRAQMTVRTTHDVVDENGDEFSCCPLVLILVRNPQFVRKIRADPLGQLRREPTQDRACCTVLVGHPSWLWVQVFFVNNTIAQEAMPIVDLGGTVQASVDECQCPACCVPACPPPGHEAPYGIRIMNINHY